MKEDKIPHIAIIGGGFCGIMTAVNLIGKARNKLKITIVNSVNPLGRGIAYNTYSKNHLLNVTASNMSAFPDEQNNFTYWVSKQKNYKQMDVGLLSKTFLPRNLYGTYLEEIWNETLTSKSNEIDIKFIDDLGS